MTPARRALDSTWRHGPNPARRPADLTANLYGTDKGTGCWGHHDTVSIGSSGADSRAAYPHASRSACGMRVLRMGRQTAARPANAGAMPFPCGCGRRYFPARRDIRPRLQRFHRGQDRALQDLPRRCIERRRTASRVGGDRRRIRCHHRRRKPRIRPSADHARRSVPAVKPGGLFIIEDLFFQPADREPAGATKTVDVLRRAEVTGEFRGSHLAADAIPYLEQHVERVRLVRFARAQGAHPAPRQPWGALEEGHSAPGRRRRLRCTFIAAQC